MEAKWTPGPWFLEGNWDASNGRSLGGWVSSFPPSGSPVFALEPIVGSDEEIAANAHLIAAAPDLYAALEEANRLLGSIPAARSNPKVSHAIMANRRALAKARGEA